MPTIKRKVEMNLPQLIEWAWDNDIKNAVYNSKNGLSANFSFDGKAVIGYAFSKDDTFTVEVEEKITEDTVIPKILVKTNYDHTAKEYCNSKINQFLSQYYKAFYIVNDDLTMTLIWKNGKLVE
ncbi:hypothetical protein [Mammaliicoccus lentus]|uniref:Phage protein n=1 Tax=Mammaliicoccus lentus TaxID=42858 RepID=A0ABS6GTW2_MAMLE|nr:hypothetical protein [Mammaliicoccus lentus]MBU6112516.1 hypothetical protein [Mammaliicoccus lentus]